jgi:hypothetical protein
MDLKTLQGIINGIKADEDTDAIEKEIEETLIEEHKRQEEESDPYHNKLSKQSRSEVPNTVKQHGKRAFSPLARKEQPKVPQEYQRPYVIGICGGPSSGKSSVANLIKDKLPGALILNLINFYKPVRGNLRRQSRADSMIDDKEKGEEQIIKEIRQVYR